MAATAPLLCGWESAADATDGPIGLPAGIVPTRAVYTNWDETISTTSLWTYSPRSQGEVVSLANWAHRSGWRIRPAGFRHSWSPLTVEGGQKASDPVLLLDTTRHLTARRMSGTSLVAQTGLSLDGATEFLHANGRGFTNIPAPGDVSIGGVLAVGAHGTSVPAAGEVLADGANFGSLANAVQSFVAVVWDKARGAYVQRRFDRNDPDAGPFLVGLGRVFLTEVTLRTQVAQNFRCRNITSIHEKDLFAHPDRAGSSSLSSLLDSAGRVGLIWYAFTSYPWVQRWDVTPTRPLLSRPTYGAYNYPFADRYPKAITDLLGALISGVKPLTALFGKKILTLTRVGLLATGATDMWGPAHYFQRFVKPTTLRVSAGSHALLTRRDRVQLVVNRFATAYKAFLAEYARAGKYPINSCVEIRVTGVDRPEVSGIAGAVAPTLSASAPDPAHPDYDTVVWLDVLTVAGTRCSAEFFADLEAFMRSDLTPLGTLRPEWAKRFAHTRDGGAWTDAEDLRRRIPAAIPGFAAAKKVYAAYDPHGVFESAMLGKLGL